MSDIVREKARQQLERFAHLREFPVTAIAMDDLLDAFERVCDGPTAVTELCNELVEGGLEKAPGVADIRRAGRVSHAQDRVWDAPEEFNCSACEDTRVITDGVTGFDNPRVCGCTPEPLKAAARKRVARIKRAAEKLRAVFPDLERPDLPGVLKETGKRTKLGGRG